MIAMQYCFVLPADYDMTIIENRIKTRAPLLDGLPGLRLKAYAFARQNAPELHSQNNLYAPFYVWQDADSMVQFLASPAFAGLTRDFGRPSVQSWAVTHANIGPQAKQALYASSLIRPIDALAEMTTKSHGFERNASPVQQQDIVAEIEAIEPRNWTRVRFEMRRTPPAIAEGQGQNYNIGYVSLAKLP